MSDNRPIQVVTWKSASGETLEMCASCETSFDRNGGWPADATGNGFSTSVGGSHPGRCSCCGEGQTVDLAAGQ